MTWHALATSKDEIVATEVAALGIAVARPMHRLTYWDSRKSVRVTRSQPLLPGYLLVGASSLPRGFTRHWYEFLVDHTSGIPLRVHDANDLILRCERGEYDVNTDDVTALSVGDQVLVAALGVVGEILAVFRRKCVVAISDREVSVPRAGLALV